MLPWVSAFLVTQLIECPIYAKALSHRERPWRIAFAISLLTHPVVFFVFPVMGFTDYWTMVSCAELFAVITEAAFLSYLGVRRSILWAWTANMASLGVGLALRWVFAWP